MNRREFLKAATAAIATAALPLAVEGSPETWKYGSGGVGQTWEASPGGFLSNKELMAEVKQVYDNHWDTFDPAFRHGNGISLLFAPTPEATKHVVRSLYEDMKKWIPPPYRDLVQIYGPIKVDFGRSVQVAWLYLPPGQVWEG